ncbi:hypothetical protein FACS1894139_10350 [Planctomycetales bacterium]|nr:hypothetical protein FACS1894108_04870 [Planctomycetales bacterium]GHT05821.1 hypothetical protein FACS1894139_10350 [Planctomycetales bacterium]
MNAHQAAETISHFLANPAAQPDAALTAAATLYAATIEQINVRLLRAASLLNRGMRAEAVFLAAQKPSLFDLYESCGFTGSEDWSETAELNGLPVPPVLRKRDDIDRLRGAAEEEEKVAALLRQYRRQCLLGAPFADRLATARQLSTGDDPEIWRSELTTLEPARQKELADEVAAAVSAKDLDALARFYAELSAGWQHPADIAELLNQVLEAHNQCRYEQATTEFSRLAKKMVEAHSALAINEAITLRQQWDEFAEECGFEPPAEIAAETEAAREWLNAEEGKVVAEQKFTAAIRALDDGLNRDLPANEINKRLRLAESFNREIPEGLLVAAEKALAAEELSAHRRFRLRLVKYVAAAVVVVGSLTGGIYAYHRHRLAAGWEEKIAAAINRHDYAASEKLLADLRAQDPALFTRPELHALATRHATETQTETDRAAQFAAESAKLTNPIDYDLWHAALTALRPLATTDRENRQIADAETRLRAAIVADFNQRLVTLTQNLNALKGGFDDDKILAQTDAMQKEIIRLQRWAVAAPQAQYLDDQQTAPLKNLAQAAQQSRKAAADRIEEARKKQNSREDAVAALLTAGKSGDIEKYASHLKEFLNRFADATTRREGWERATTALPTLRAILTAETIREALLPYLKDGVKRENVERAKSATQKAAELLRDGANRALPEESRKMWEALNAAVTQECLIGDEAVQAELADLRKFLNVKIIGNLYWCEWRENGNKKYAYMDNNRVDGSEQAPMLTIFGTRATAPDEVKKHVRAEDLLQKPTLTPVSVFAGKLKSNLRQWERDGKNPAAFFLTAAENCLKMNDADVVMPQIWLLQKLLILAKTFSASAAQKKLDDWLATVGDLQQRLATGDDGEIAEFWFTEDNSMEERKKELRREMRQFNARDLAAIRQDATKQLAAWREKIPPPMKWVGVLRANDGRWELAGSPSASAAAYFALDANGALRPITLDGGQVTGDGDFFNGQPVVAEIK